MRQRCRLYYHENVQYARYEGRDVLLIMRWLLVWLPQSLPAHNLAKRLTLFLSRTSLASDALPVHPD
jgi:hypothetical protein